MAAIGLAGGLLAPLLAPAPVEAEVVNQIVLRINSRIATEVDFRRRLAERRQALLAAEMDDGERQRMLGSAGREIYRTMYEEMLLLSRADQLDIRVSDDEVQEAVINARRRMGIETEEEFAAALESSGLTRSQLETQLRNNLTMQRLMAQEVQERIDVEEEDLRRYYREHETDFELPERLHLREIIVLEEAFPTADELAEYAAGVVARLDAGETLEEVAVEGEASGQTTSVIDHGVIISGDLAPELEAAAWELETGEHSAPVAGRGGLHVLEVVDRRPAELRPFQEVRQVIEARERERKLDTVYPYYMRELEEAAYIVMKLPPEAVGFEGLPKADSEDPILPPG